MPLMVWVGLRRVALFLLLLGAGQSFALSDREYSSITSQGLFTYKLHLPRPRPSGPIPVLVALHGCKQDADDFAELTGFNELADERGFAVLYPEQSRLFRNIDGCWNWFLKDNQAREKGEPSLIMEALSKVKSSFSINPEKIFLAGFSSGAAMASNLVSAYPEIFAGVALHSGLEYQAATGLFSAQQSLEDGSLMDPRESAQEAFEKFGRKGKPFDVLVVHGTADTRVNPRNSEQVFRQLVTLNDYLDDGVANGSLGKMRTIEKQVPGGCSYIIESLVRRGGPSLRRILVRGLAHKWAGSHADSEYADPLGPNISRIIVDQFMGPTRKSRPPGSRSTACEKSLYFRAHAFEP